MGKDLRDLLGRRLREARKRLGLTQKELASRIEGRVDYTYIGRIERGTQFPSLKMLQKLGKALSLPLTYFFEEGEEKAEKAFVYSHLEGLFRRRKGREFLNLLSQLPPEDIDFLIEITKLLGKHRRSTPWSGLKVAEAERSYTAPGGVIEELKELLEREERKEVKALLERVLAELKGKE